MKEERKQLDLKVRLVDDYNRYIGVRTTHSLVSVVHYDELPPCDIPVLFGESLVYFFLMIQMKNSSMGAAGMIISPAV